MPSDVITIEDMNLIFEVTDAFGIDREKLSVSLGKEDPGRVSQLHSGELEIVLPLTVPLPTWLPVLRRELEALGFRPE